MPRRPLILNETASPEGFQGWELLVYFNDGDHPTCLASSSLNTPASRRALAAAAAATAQGLGVDILLMTRSEGTRLSMQEHVSHAVLALGGDPEIFRS